MRRLLIYCTVAAFAATLVGCKTTEANYRAAYEKAMEGRASTIREDSTIYMRIRQQFNAGEMTYKGRTIPTGSQYVKITENGGGINEDIKKYCVVAGGFKQVFNAKSMRRRLTQTGYPGAFVVQTAEPYYFVVAGSSQQPEPAVEIYDKLKADSALMLRDPMPFILLPSQIK